MTELKVGDRVTVKGWETRVTSNNYWEGRTGTVYDAGNPDAVCVEFDDQQGTNFHKGGFEAQYLVPAEKPFTFADIQVGDKIRRTLTRETGTTEVREGTVTAKSEHYATDGGKGTGYILSYSSDGDHDKPQVVLELLDRPEPKHWTETKPVGSVAVILDGQFTKTITKVNEGEWRVYYSIDGFNYTDANPHVKARTADLDEAKLTWIK